jgi:CBS domain-containing protein
MKVQNIMSTEAFSVGSEQSLHDAARLMWEHNCGSAPVVNEDNQVVGMVTDRDIAMAAYLNGSCLSDIPVSVAQSKEVVCCKPDDEIDDVQYKMRTYQLHRIPVIDSNSQAVGIVSLNDIACAYKAGTKGVKAQDISMTLAAICNPMKQLSSVPKSVASA